MEEFNGDFSLHDLLCFKESSKIFRMGEEDTFNKLITEWAEKEVMSGNNSSTLLIIASLNLDAQPDRNDVESYLPRYLNEISINYPTYKISLLVWLKHKISLIYHADSAKDIEALLYFFAVGCFDYPPRLLARTSNFLSDLYYILYDDLGQELLSLAASMSDEEILAYVRIKTLPYYRILNSRDWISFLAR